ncbi:hypothetical protein KFE25_009254 [Diacronema lutheri]|uniref:Uncharacterized protein n=1 Tax=Diacronema lutheri TaxID=2081491 RepID=A0A8J5XSD6_DIALT|nr:hypothetical protein KFE25_009254 [Diacronema lutheri]
MLSIQPDDLLKLKEENDELERSIMQHTRKFDVTDDTVPLKEPAPPPKVGGIKVYKFNELPQFTTEAVSDRGTPYMPLQCKKRGHDGTMFTS